MLELYKKYFIEQDGHYGLESYEKNLERFERNGFGQLKIQPNKVCPYRPCSIRSGRNFVATKRASGRMLGLLSRGLAGIQNRWSSRGLRQQAPVELDKPVSRHPALRTNDITGSYSAPLDQGVSLALPGVVLA